MRASTKVGKNFVFLSDPDGRLAASYAGTYSEGRMKGILKPGTVVVGRGGKIVYGISDEDYKVRPAAQAVLAAVRTAMQKTPSKPAAAK